MCYFTQRFRQFRAGDIHTENATHWQRRRASGGPGGSGRQMSRGSHAPPAPAAAMAGSPAPSSQEALLLELKGLQQEPVEGVSLSPVDEGRLPTWAVAIFGPDTYDEGGYFKAPREPPRRPPAC